MICDIQEKKKKNSILPPRGGRFFQEEVSECDSAGVWFSVANNVVEYVRVERMPDGEFGSPASTMSHY